MRIRRLLLIFVIVAMCGIVFIGGNIALVSSNSVLKYSIKNNNGKPVYKVLIDLTENKLYLIDKSNIISSYPVSPEKKDNPSPIGKWKIVQKDVGDKKFSFNWLGLSVPWGKFGISGTTEMGKISSSVYQGCVGMLNSDMEKLYKLVGVGTEVVVYGGPYGPFGNGHKTINSGDRGADVYEIQKRLKKLGFYKGIVDGIYGEDLRTAIYKFEENKGLEVTDSLSGAFYSKLGIKLIN